MPYVQEKSKCPADVHVRYQGSVVLIYPETPAGQAWCDENMQVESWQRFGGGIACEPRMTPPVVEGMREAGLVVA